METVISPCWADWGVWWGRVGVCLLYTEVLALEPFAVSLPMEPVWLSCKLHKRRCQNGDFETEWDSVYSVVWCSIAVFKSIRLFIPYMCWWWSLFLDIIINSSSLSIKRNIKFPRFQNRCGWHFLRMLVTNQPVNAIETEKSYTRVQALAVIWEDRCLFKVK